MYICKYCDKKFSTKMGLSIHLLEHEQFFIDRDGNNEKYLKRIEKRNKTINKIKKDTKKKKLLKEKEWAKEKHTCEKCGKTMTKKFGSGRFCSRKCANSRIVTEEHKAKTSQTLKNRYKMNPSKLRKNIKDFYRNEKEKQCVICGKKFFTTQKKRKCCSKPCGIIYRGQQQRKHNKINKKDYELYNYNCIFRFNLNEFPEEFDFELLKKYGMYSAKNHGNNYNGVSRDHIYSIKEGYLNKVDPYYISHPANCRLIQQKVNNKKHTKCDITKEELYKKVEEWNNKYGVYPNKIDI